MIYKYKDLEYLATQFLAKRINYHEKCRLIDKDNFYAFYTLEVIEKKKKFIEQVYLKAVTLSEYELVMRIKGDEENEYNILNKQLYILARDDVSLTYIYTDDINEYEIHNKRSTKRLKEELIQDKKTIAIYKNGTLKNEKLRRRISQFYRIEIPKQNLIIEKIATPSKNIYQCIFVYKGKYNIYCFR